MSIYALPKTGLLEGDFMFRFYASGGRFYVQVCAFFEVFGVKCFKFMKILLVTNRMTRRSVLSFTIQWEPI